MSYHQLVENQRAYWRSGALNSLEERKKILTTYKNLIQTHAKEITDAIYTDLHRISTEPDHLVREIDSAIANLESWAAPIKVSTAPFTGTDDQAFVYREGYGVVLVIAPWNFPLICSGPSVSAFAAGNTVVLKLSEVAPTFSSVFARLVNQTFDPRVFVAVEGAVPEVTSLLEEKFDYIMYTGNPNVGRIIMSAASKNLTPVTLELGGKNPVLVEPDADLDDAAKKIVFAKTLNCGQICISADYVLTTAEIRPKLIAAIKKVYDSMLPLKQNQEFARIVHERHFDRLSNILSNTKGEIFSMSDESADRTEKFLPPAVIAIEQDDVFMNEEIFGPYLPIIVSPSFEESVKFVVEREKPLGAYIFTKDQEKAKKFVALTSSGGVTINDVMAHGFLHCAPFGGVGNSGMGRLNLKYGFDTFTHEKAVLVRNGLSI
ncbi:unnamed protein product [Auanema sp. JU1783]|nr:unnamed protein product [Auanema sp. JU1783]